MSEKFKAIPKPDVSDLQSEQQPDSALSINAGGGGLRILKEGPPAPEPNCAGRPKYASKGIRPRWKI